MRVRFGSIVERCRFTPPAATDTRIWQEIGAEGRIRDRLTSVAVIPSRSVELPVRYLQVSTPSSCSVAKNLDFVAEMFV